MNKQMIPAYFFEEEPGDMTYYSFIVVPLHGRFIVIPTQSTFKFPAVLHEDEVRAFQMSPDNWPIAMQIAERFDCNPCTVEQCLKAAARILTRPVEED